MLVRCVPLSENMIQFFEVALCSEIVTIQNI
jgi:hypothetical protein